MKTNCRGSNSPLKRKLCEYQRLTRALRRQEADAVVGDCSVMCLDPKQQARQIRRLTRKLTQAEQTERKRLANLLHDHLQQLLVAARFNCDGLKKDLALTRHAAEAEKIGALLEESIQASKSLTIELYPPILHEKGLAAGLKWLSHWMLEKHGLQVEMNLERLKESEDRETTVLLFESVRELLFNVIKHSGVKEAIVETIPGDGEMLQLAVTDHGIGFDPRDVRARRQQDAGGFGLFSIDERLSLLGGRLEINSRPGQGSRFTLRLPVRSVPLGFPEEESPDDAGPQLSGRHRIRVLIADDHMIIRRGLSLLLEREEDFQVVGEAVDGLEAVALSERLQPDTVVMDLRMPGLSGIEAARQIRLRIPKVRILAMSNYSEPETVSEAFDAGAAAFVQKSQRIETMLAVLRSITCPPLPSPGPAC